MSTSVKVIGSKHVDLPSTEMHFCFEHALIFTTYNQSVKNDSYYQLKFVANYFIHQS